MPHNTVQYQTRQSETFTWDRNSYLTHHILPIQDFFFVFQQWRTQLQLQPVEEGVLEEDLVGEVEEEGGDVVVEEGGEEDRKRETKNGCLSLNSAVLLKT